MARRLATFTGEAPGELLTVPRGTQGFGYDPLFYFPALGKTFAELSLEQKREHSHRGKAFRQFLDWYVKQPRNGRTRVYPNRDSISAFRWLLS